MCSHFLPNVMFMLKITTREDNCQNEEKFNTEEKTG